jgi:hypothetical protein
LFHCLRCLLFALGVLGAEAGWLDKLPPVLARRLGWVAAAGVAALVVLTVSLVVARGADRALVMGADLPTMAFALLDGVIAVNGTLWFIAWLRGPVAHPRPAARQGSTGVLRHLRHPPAGAHRNHGAAGFGDAGTRNQVRAGGHRRGGRQLCRRSWKFPRADR